MAKTHSDSKLCHVTVLLTYGYLLTTEGHPFGLFYLIPCYPSRKKNAILRELSGHKETQAHNHCAVASLQTT